MQEYAQPKAKATETYSKYEDADAGFAEELHEPETVIHGKWGTNTKATKNFKIKDNRIRK